jgi:DNA repair protein RadA/Sms
MAKRGKNTTLFVCDVCGEEFMQWQGKCASCGNWNTLKEFTVQEPVGGARGTSYAGRTEAVPVQLSTVAGLLTERASSGFGEIDRVLGGGVVPGSVILLGGDPGIGKSTLLLQMVDRMSGDGARTILYVSGEESPEQIKLRAQRIGVTSSSIQVLAGTNVNGVAVAIEQQKPALVVIDSIQTMYDPAFPSTPGSIVQVRESALSIQRLAKTLGVPVVLVGHITKEGTIAGPRTLEHLVDVVLYLEGDAQHHLRILRAVKNRFGDISETGIFAMEERGMVEVVNPSSFLLGERVQSPGSVLSAVIEGSRPMLIEVQALTTASVFGLPRRTASGFDLNRLNLLLAVLQKQAGVNLSSQDVFVNIVGGVKVKDPAVDAAICLAVASSYLEKVLPEKLCVIGEVGLAGEIRRVTQQERRTKEIEGLGYQVAPSEKQLRKLIARFLSK